MKEGLLSRTTEKPAFLCDSRKSRTKGPSLCHVTKTSKQSKQSDFDRVRLAIPHYIWKSLIPCFLEIDGRGDQWWIQTDINSCFYGVAAAPDQKSCDAQIKILFSALDRVEGIFGEPGHGHFLLGDTITERNIRLFTTIVKFSFTYFIQCFTLWVETHWVP
jgi:glutathionyl-hydroquinone reductase